MDKVCILAAGRGTRVSSNTPKALLPVNYQAVLSHIIGYFKEDTQFIIAVGYQSYKIKDFLALVYPDRDITFVDIDNWQGEGSGPGYSLLQCKPWLNGPFYFISSDTLVGVSVPPLDRNWIGVAKVSDPENYLTVEVDQSGHVTKLVDKQPADGTFRQAFIGLAGVHDSDSFWDSLIVDTRLKSGEYQVSNGLEGLINGGLDTYSLKYHDTGTKDNYEKALKYYNEFEFLPKPGEFLYFERGKVVKYFADEDCVRDRVARAGLLGGTVPRILAARKNFYQYKYVDGERISHTPCDPKLYMEFLEFCNSTIWQEIPLTIGQTDAFITACYQFYQDKTNSRVDGYLQSRGEHDVSHIINGRHVLPVKTMLNKVDWCGLATGGNPVLFHGDPQPENIIVNDGGGFTLLDWRQDFAGLLEMGDLYYDLAKIYHALIISGDVIRAGRYTVDGSNFNFDMRNNLMQFRRVFEKFCGAYNFSISKVRLLSALVFLNIAPLYADDYGKLLFYLGKFTLSEVLEGEWTI